MKITRVAFCLPLAFFFFAAASAAKVTITNKCPYTVWPATLTGGDNPQQLSKTGFELQNGASDSVDVPAPWKGRFWARTGCSSDSGKFACATGDCASGQVGCNGATGQPPATLAELTVAAAGEQDNYDVSNVDGFNVPVSIAPQGGSGDCRSRSCPANINSACPADLQVNGTDGSVIGCKSACVAFNQDQYCCKGAFNSSQTCQPTDYSRFFKNQCPEAYSYAYDDPTSLVTCSGGPSYTVTFCPN